MQLCDIPLPSPSENLAADEALLDLCEEGGAEGILRFWEPSQYFVVAGYGNAIASEVEVTYCAQNGILVLRRTSGGGTVLQGPGCLNYSVILSVASAPALQNISGTNRFVLERTAAALQKLVEEPIEIRGHTDLAIEERKFAGNAQRRKKNFLLFHGCFLLHMDLAIIESTLSMPSRQPEYRQSRRHSEFLRNLNLPASLVKQALRKEWQAESCILGLPSDRIAELVKNKYSARDWTWRR